MNGVEPMSGSAKYNEKVSSRSKSTDPSGWTNASTICLTNGSVYSNVCSSTATRYAANHAERANAPHGSNPTLQNPVHGLSSIISALKQFVLRGTCGPTEPRVGVGRFHLQMTREVG